MDLNMAAIGNQTVQLSDHSQSLLSRFWQNSPLVLVFLRHYGWPFCREQVAQLRREKVAFEQLGAQVVLVGLGSVEETAEFKKQFKVPYTMIADPKRQLFEAFRLKRASTGSLLSPGTAVKGLKAMVKGHGLGVPKGDVRQLPGVFIIDSKGRIRFSYHATGPADHPQPEDLLAVLRGDAAV